MDIATLGIAVQSSQVDEAARDLKGLSVAAGQAEKATDRLSASSRMAGQNSGQSSPLITRLGQSTKSLANDNMILAFQLNDVAVSLASGMNPMMVAVQQGSQISQLYAGNGGVAMAFKQTGLMAQSAALYIGRLALANPIATASAVALGLGLRSVLNDLQAAGYESIGYGDVTVAAFQVVASGIGNILLPAFQAISPTVTSVLDTTTSFFKDWGNGIIRLALGSFETIKAGVMALPAAFVAAGGAAANGFLAGIEWMVREAMVGVNSLIASINGAMPSGMKIGNLGAPTDFKIGRFDSSGALASIKQQYADLDATATKIMNTDYLGQFGNAIKAKAIANGLKEVETAAGGAGNALKKAANDNADPWSNLRDTTARVSEEMAKLQTQQDSVLNAGKTLGAEFGNTLKGLLDGTTDWKDALLSTFKSILQYSNQMNVAGGGKGLFGGGIFQSILGGLIGVPNFANGTNSAPGGLTRVNERGGEIMNLPRGTQVIPHDISKRMASNANQKVDVKVGVEVTNEGGLRAFVMNQNAQVAAGVMGAVPAAVDVRMSERNTRRVRPRGL